MAIIKCRECGNPVSDKAVRCPHCGCVINANGAQPQNGKPEERPAAPYQGSSGSSRPVVAIVVALSIVAVLALGAVGFFCYRLIEHNEYADDYRLDSVPSETSVSYGNDDYAASDGADSSYGDYDYSLDSLERAAEITAERDLEYADISGLSTEELRILRNWIFAKHGYIFHSEDLQEYFGAKDWYTPVSTNVTAELTDVERRNVAFIKRYE